MSTTISTKRIEWIDALRGFTMLFVVYYHLEVCGLFIDSPAHGLNGFFRTFRMPLFFFISGFVAYKNNELWNLNNYKTKLIKKRLMMRMYLKEIGLKIDALVIMTIKKREIICFQIQINGNMIQHIMN